MSHACCVPKCNWNYKNGPKVSVFSFPNNDEARSKWTQAIKRVDFVPNKNSKIRTIIYLFNVSMCIAIGHKMSACSKEASKSPNLFQNCMDIHAFPFVSSPFFFFFSPSSVS